MNETRLATMSDVVTAVRLRHETADLAIVHEAFRIADQTHQGQRRQSGHPYIVHPLAVAFLLAEWGEPPFVVALGLVHDVPDAVGISEELRTCVGDRGVCILEAINSLDVAPHVALAQLQARFAGEPDLLDLIIRVKIADRTHNARTWSFVPRQRAIEKALQTRQALVPLARSLGLDSVADELDELSAGYLGESNAPRVPGADGDEEGQATRGLSTEEDRITARLLRQALDLLPEHERSRYAAEWAADLAVTRGRRQRVLLAAGLVYSAHRLRADRRRTASVFLRPTR